MIIKIGLVITILIFLFILIYSFKKSKLLVLSEIVIGIISIILIMHTEIAIYYYSSSLDYATDEYNIPQASISHDGMNYNLQFYLMPNDTTYIMGTFVISKEDNNSIIFQNNDLTKYVFYNKEFYNYTPGTIIFIEEPMRVNGSLLEIDDISNIKVYENNINYLDIVLNGYTSDVILMLVLFLGIEFLILLFYIAILVERVR